MKKRIHAILAGRAARNLTFANKAALAVAAMWTVAIPIAAGMIGPLRARSQSQAVATVERFDVASVKPTAPENAGTSRPSVLLFMPNSFRMTNTTLKSLIQTAYRVQEFQIMAGPSWLNSDRYDVEGKAAPNTTPDREQLLSMVRALLADRFKLTLHRETREGSEYALVVGKDGLRIHLAADPLGGARGGANGRLIGKSSMPQLAQRLSTILRRPVVDKTGVSGVYEFTLEWLPDENQFLVDGPPPPPANPSAPSIFTAIQEQLGLRLDSQRGPVDVLLIDGAEKPSPN